MQFNFLIDFIKHRISANNRHGTHSPFVYKLADEVIYEFKENEDFKIIEKHRFSLLNDNRALNITDLGAGSLLNKEKSKKVKEVAANALKKPALAQLLYRLSKYFKPSSIIELGTCLGITTAYFAKANPNAKIITIEGCPQTASIAAEGFNELGLKNVELLIGNFDNVLPEVLKTINPLDFVYVDGNHRKDATLNYFQWCLANKNDDTILIFDDIYWSKGMKEAWEEIKNHPEVTVTIDMFWIGLVSFRKGQAKEHFKLKY